MLGQTAAQKHSLGKFSFESSDLEDGKDSGVHTAGQNCVTIGRSGGAATGGDGRESAVDFVLTSVRQYQYAYSELTGVTNGAVVVHSSSVFSRPFVPILRAPQRIDSPN
ncbi:hypothetical protein CYV19_15195 [Natronobacterium gregoryi SP2]|uniref:Uncharacterized protein n=1 Tax=Natronobacterium gregoryi (strain ATCC 43098 / DSM 3393 / CCM 3738 / CIP 104747 / IAM 13177 / JCM 8860 / NBRC 102187 / NCIMB 2189 / SP2) TaxID=797304 RepID=A0A2J4JBU8_NATGS|nr:hypothetical protein CYV19_15195 [Natronobacterium gregoryi SP2]